MAEEVRFRNGNSIIDNDNTGKSQSWTRFTDYLHDGVPNKRQNLSHLLRPQAMVNKDGLIELNLTSRSLLAIPPTVFTQLRLEVLKVDGNQLTLIPSDIAKLHKLRKFHAQKNRITAVHETIANCAHLQYIDLSENELRQIPRSIGMLHNVKVLKLAGNKLETLPHELGDMSSLRQLELANNGLWHIPASLQKLRHLRFLNLAGNSLDQLPLCVCHLKNLEALDVHGNHLNTLPPDLSGLRALREFSLASNRFESVPYCILALRQLQSLDMSTNQLRLVPVELAQMPKLRMLILQGNQLTDFPSGFSHLKYLNLAHNRLQDISLVKSNPLQYLNMSHNNLENMPHGIYNLANLQVLKLANNQIFYVSQDVILLKRLRILDLSDNRLTNLPQVIDELEHLEVFNIQGNKIDSRTHSVGQQRHHDPRHSLPRAKRKRTASRHPRLTGQSMKPRKKKKTHTRYPWQKKPFSVSRLHKTIPPSKHISTQYTPRSTLRSRRNSMRPTINPSLFDGTRQKSSNTLLKSTNGLDSTSFPTHPNSLKASTFAPIELEAPQNPRSISEIVYPMTNASNLHQPTDLDVKTEVTRRDPPSISKKPSKNGSNSYTENWINERLSIAGSGSSNAVTINESIGDNLSLGEEDFHFLPLNVPDVKLMKLCSEAETWLNNQLLKPFQINRGIFRKSMNAGGTLRTLRGITHQASPLESQVTMVTEQSQPTASLDRVIQMTKDIYLRRPDTSQKNFIQRYKMDVFRVTPSGGIFKSSTDPRVTLHFPIDTVDRTIAITIQVEKISIEALEIMKKVTRSVETLLSVGDIIHVTQNRDVDFREPVTVTIPAPALMGDGNLHLVTYHEDNTCSPCSAQYRLQGGYIRLKAWHFSGRGAILAKTKDKYKACKAMSQLLHHLYV